MTTSMQRTRATSVWDSPATSYYLLAASTTILLLVGLAVVLSSTSIASITKENGNAWSLFLVQVAALVVGGAAMVLGSRIPVAGWKQLTPWVLFGAIGLLLVVMTSGISSGGNRNWIPGPVTLQPSEMAKLGLALYLGMVLGASASS